MKAFFRKTTVFMLLAVMIFTFAACSTNQSSGGNEGNTQSEKSNDANPSNDETSSQQENVTLHFRHTWITEHEEKVKEIFDDIIADFEAEHDNINIEVETIDQETHRQQKLKAEMVSGNPPEIFVLWGGAELEPYVKANRMLDLTSFLEEEGLKDQFTNLEMFTFDDKVYGLPLNGYAEGIYYNKEIFSEVGVEVPTTFQELLNAVQKLKEAGYVPMALANKDKWPGGMIWQFFLNRYSGYEHAKNLAIGEGTWDTPEVRSATEAFIQLVDEGAFPEGANGLPYEQQGSMFLNEEAAMVLTGSWDAERFESDPDFAQKVGFFNFPSIEGGNGDQTSICAGFSFGLGFSANMTDAQKEAAYAFIKAVYNEEIQQRYVYEAKRVPSMKIEFDTSKIGPVFGQVLSTLQESTSTWLAYDGVFPPSVTQAYFGAIQSILQGTTVDEVIEQMENAQKEFVSSQ